MPRRRTKSPRQKAYTKLAKMSKRARESRRAAAYTQMAEVLVRAQAPDWATRAPVEDSKHGVKVARFQAARMSLTGWSGAVVESTVPGYTLHKDRWYRLRPDGERGRRVKGVTVDRARRTHRYVAQVHLVQSIMGSTYKQAQASLRTERDGWQEYLDNPAETEPGHVPSPGLAEEEEELAPEEETGEMQRVAMTAARARVERERFRKWAEKKYGAF